MGCLMEQPIKIEQTREKVYELLVRCIEDVQRAVTSSGLTMRDVGLGIEMYQTTAGSKIVELKLR